MIDRFQGDPKIYIDPDGASLSFESGQPVMDQGFENQAFISLFTSPGWWGNTIIQDPDKQIGSDYEETAKGAVTLQKLNQIRQAGIRALKYSAFGNIEGVVTNPVSSQLLAVFTIHPPGLDAQELIITRNGQNWVNQAMGE